MRPALRSVLVLTAASVLALTGCSGEEGSGRVADGPIIPGVSGSQNAAPPAEDPTAVPGTAVTPAAPGEETSQAPTSAAPGAAFVGGDQPIPENWPAGFVFPADIHYVTTSSSADTMNVSFNSAGTPLELGEYLHQQAVAVGFVQERDTSDSDSFNRLYVSSDGVWSMLIVTNAFDAEAGAQVGISRI